jgi:hypothetical protein
VSRLEWALWGLDFLIGGVGFIFGGPYAGLMCFAAGGILILVGLLKKDESESPPTSRLVDYRNRPYATTPRVKKWHKWGLATFGLCLLILICYGVIIPQRHKPINPQYPAPKGPGIRVDATAPIPSSQMCLGLTDEEQTPCFCPRQLSFTITALSPPSDNNYSTEMTITQPPEQFQRIRVFLRAPISVANLVDVVPNDNDAHSVTTLGLLDYDKFSFVIQSSAPKMSYKIVMNSSEQMRIRCVSYQN